MKKITLSADIAVFEDETTLADIEKNLLAKAKYAAQGAYAPYSKFKVGAAVQLIDGTIVLGSNQENAAYPVTMCGERTAIFAAAAQHPTTAIERVAITIISNEGNINRPVPPCGSCRQVIYEYELRYNRNIQLILQGDFGEVYILDSIKDILPLLFDSSYL